jgi:serine/threonine-protein kinase RsbW
MLRAPDGTPTLVHLPAERGAVPRLVDWLDHRIALLDLPAKAAYAVRLCAEESVLNVILHGKSGTVSVWLGRCAGRLSLCVKDSGPAFDPSSAEPRPRPATLEDARVGGMGIMLMRQFSTGMVYRRAFGANRLLLSFEG